MTIHWQSLTADAKVDAIKSVYSPGMSSQDIATVIGVSRKAILSLYDRRREALSTCPLLPQNGSKTVQKWAAKPIVTTSIACAEVEPPLNISLMDLERHHCRWPVTDDGPHLFCGRDKAEGSSYCAGHARLSVGRGTEGERSADRTLLAAA